MAYTQTNIEFLKNYCAISLYIEGRGSTVITPTFHIDFAIFPSVFLAYKLPCVLIFVIQYMSSFIIRAESETINTW